MHRSRASRNISAANTNLVAWRQNYDPQRDTPMVVRDALMKWGGTNLYGEPLWRVILAQNHQVMRDGEWHNRDENQDSVVFHDDKQNMGNGAIPYETRNVAPTSITRGPHWVPLYPCQGWILERWFPASCFGDKLAWESVLSQDGITPMMGPYPARGDYWLMKGPWDHMPELAAFRMGISGWENSTKHMHGKIDQALFDISMKNFMKLLEEEEEAQYLRVLKQAGAMRKEFERDMANPRLTGWKNGILNSRGMNGHFGV